MGKRPWSPTQNHLCPLASCVPASGQADSPLPGCWAGQPHVHPVGPGSDWPVSRSRGRDLRFHSGSETPTQETVGIRRKRKTHLRKTLESKHNPTLWAKALHKPPPAPHNKQSSSLGLHQVRPRWASLSVLLPVPRHFPCTCPRGAPFPTGALSHPCSLSVLCVLFTWRLFRPLWC